MSMYDFVMLCIAVLLTILAWQTNIFKIWERDIRKSQKLEKKKAKKANKKKRKAERSSSKISNIDVIDYKDDITEDFSFLEEKTEDIYDSITTEVEDNKVKKNFVVQKSVVVIHSDFII